MFADRYEPLRPVHEPDAGPALPIGLAYLAGALAASPHAVKTLDLMFSADPLGDVEQAVRVQPW